ncbi:isoamylase [Brucepastera parasyntrophica]|uniref:isoamylase n=1 Tax=Brucepastera parasyntrophica TaxID=2880008 RepID=UPI00210B8D41|nr:isoamylase [Brucepastera parasyntrophica]ULQ59342.1 isoamylase [Brucepastera parasyntrophica]
MKRKLLFLFVFTCIFLIQAAGAEINAITYQELVASISRVQEPLISDKHVIFTARGDARYVGIAFEHEDYRFIHSFQRIIRRDLYGKPQVDDQGRPLETVLFYIAEIPPEMKELTYRMVVDGLWTTDPQNPHTKYDYINGMNVSILPVEYYEIFQTSQRDSNLVKFTYEGNPGAVIRLAGTFNNWDPFMYELTEISPGRYEISLPLPKGTWYYAYFEGTTQRPDSTNSNHVYTKDGRVASVLVVK